jgi:hypothetical protein
VPFAPTFSPLDYIASIEQCARARARIVIVDSMSHEHDGAGGVLEWHEQEVERLMKAWKCTGDKANIPAWNRPKSARRKLINAVLQMQCNFVFCFRAKDKVKIGKGEVTQLGFMPIAGEEFVYELTAKSLLLPGAEGVPTLQSDQPGERMMIKLPEQFRDIFTGKRGQPLDEDVGEQMARWAAGEDKHELAAAYMACNDAVTFETLEKRRADVWKTLSAAAKREVKSASEAAAERIVSAPAAEVIDKETGEVLTLDGNPPDPEATAIAALEAAFKKGPKKVAAAWADITGDFARRDAEIPLAIEAKFVELRDALSEKDEL